MPDPDLYWRDSPRVRSGWTWARVVLAVPQALVFGVFLFLGIAAVRDGKMTLGVASIGLGLIAAIGITMAIDASIDRWRRRTGRVNAACPDRR